MKTRRPMFIRGMGLTAVALLSLLGAEIPPQDENTLVLMLRKYFDHYHQAPRLLGAGTYTDGRERIFRAEILADRNRNREDLIFAFRALATVGKYSRSRLHSLVVVLHSDQPGILPEIYTGNADCARDCFVANRISLKKWYNNCLVLRQL